MVWGGRDFSEFLEGKFAVAVFFVLSGYVLSLSFHNAPDLRPARAALRSLCMRRYPRLAVPVLVSVLLAYLFHDLGWISIARLGKELGPVSEGILSSYYAFTPHLGGAIRSALWDSFFHFSATTSYNVALWSMQSELLSSYFLFGFLYFFGKHPWRVILYGMTFFWLYLLGENGCIAFLLGSAICDASIHCTPRVGARLYQTKAGLFVWLGIIAVLALEMDAGRASYLILPAAAIHVALHSPLLCSTLSSAPMQFLGKISFSLYLVHLPLFCLLAFPLYVGWARSFLGNGARELTAICLLATSLAAAWGFYRLVDRRAVGFARLWKASNGQRSRGVLSGAT